MTTTTSLKEPLIRPLSNIDREEGGKTDPSVTDLRVTDPSVPHPDLMRILKGSCLEVNREFPNIFTYVSDTEHQITGTALHYVIYQIAQEEALARKNGESFQLRDSEWAPKLDVLKEHHADFDTNEAKYESEEGLVENCLSPCALAAGLGSCCAIEALFNHNEKKRSVLDRVTYKKKKGETFLPYFTPLHTAARQGQAEVLKKLVKLGASVENTVKSKETVLHALATANSSSPMSEVDLKDVVSLLLEKRADLHAKTDNKKTPFEYALLPGSCFPQTKLHLLAPSCYPSEQNRTTIFTDICSASNSSTAAAVSVGDYIASELEFMARYDAQHQGKHETLDIQDRIANLIYTAPTAAVKILKVLCDTPYVVSSGHPIEKYASFYGCPSHKDMMCAYQPDFIEECGLEMRKINRPAWKSPQEEFQWHTTFMPSGQKAAVPWYATFMPCGQKHATLASGRLDYVHECTVKALYVPDVLDIDIMWAIALTPKNNEELFQELSIQAIITGMWQGFSYHVYITDFTMSFIDGILLVTWGIIHHSKNDFKEEHHGSEMVQFCRYVLLAGILKDIVLVGSWMYHYNGKRLDAVMRFEDDDSTKWFVCLKRIIMWLNRMLNRMFCCSEYAEHKKEDKHVPSGCWSRCCENEENKKKNKDEPSWARKDGRYRSLWSFRNLRNETRVFLDLFEMALLLWLVWEAPDALEWKKHTSAIDWAKRRVLGDVLLVVNLLIRILKIINLGCGIEVHGKRITALVETFFSGSLWEMLFVCSIFLTVAFLAFSTIIRDELMGHKIVIVMYRSLFFGDGDSLESMGLTPTCADADSDAYKNSHGNGGDFEGACTGYQMLYDDVRIVLMYLITFLFSVVIVNLVIAVYSNEYDRVELMSPLYFMKNRARMNVHYYFQQQVWDCFGKGMGAKKSKKGTASLSNLALNPTKMKMVTAILFGVSILYWYLLYEPQTKSFPFMSLVFSLIMASCELLLFACARLNNWLEDEDNQKHVSKYLWVCYRSNLTTDVLQTRKLVVSDLNDVGTMNDLEIIEQNIKSTLRSKLLAPTDLATGTSTVTDLNRNNTSNMVNKIEEDLKKNLEKLQRLKKVEDGGG